MRFRDEKRVSTLGDVSLTEDKLGVPFNLSYSDSEVVSLDDMCKSIRDVWQIKASRCKRDGSQCPDFHSCLSYNPKRFKTVDAYVKGKDGRFYFIEFKNQPDKNIEQQDLFGKAVESLFCVSLSILHAVPMETIRSNSVFILVYKKDPALKTGSGEMIMRDIDMAAGRCASTGDAVLFDLDKLQKDFQLYSEVHTFGEDEFNQYCSKIF